MPFNLLTFNTTPDALYGLGSADVATDAQGNIKPGQQAQVFTAPHGGSVFNSTKSVTDGVTPGSPTGGIVTADSQGRVGFFAQSDNTLWLDFGDGVRWPVNPIEWGAIVDRKIDVLGAANQSTLNSYGITLNAINERVEETIVAADLTVGTVDLRKVQPYLAVPNLNLATTNVVQSPAKATTGEWYASQAVGGTVSGVESTRISRCSADGSLIDSMLCENAGHGTVISVQTRDDGNVWIWMGWQTVNGTSGEVTAQNLVRVKYSAGTKTKVDADVVVVSSFSTSLTYAAVDPEKDLVDLCTVYNGYYRHTLRKLSDVENGVDNPLGPTVNISTTLVGLQGFAIAGKTLYHATGSSLNPYRFLVYDLETGELKYEQSFDGLGKEANGQYLDSYKEPEGICLFRAPGGKVTIFGSITVGASTVRRHKIYAFSEGDNTALMGAAVETLNTSAYIEPNWIARSPGTSKKIANLRRPGWFYIETAQFVTMTDRPDGAPTNTGYWLQVSPANRNGHIAQELVLNRGNLGIAKWVRRSTGVDALNEYWTKLTGTYDSQFGA